jgi:hypothetical protein
LQEEPHDVLDHSSALFAMYLADIKFLNQLKEDRFLRKVFKRGIEGEFKEENVAEHDYVLSAVKTIERALVNRIQFAVHQKNFIGRLIEFIYPLSEMLRIKEEVKGELTEALRMINEWDTVPMSELYEKHSQDLADVVFWETKPRHGTQITLSMRIRIPQQSRYEK